MKDRASSLTLVFFDPVSFLKVGSSISPLCLVLGARLLPQSMQTDNADNADNNADGVRRADSESIKVR